jgi:hypothetical protein
VRARVHTHNCLEGFLARNAGEYWHFIAALKRAVPATISRAQKNILTTARVCSAGPLSRARVLQQAALAHRWQHTIRCASDDKLLVAKRVQKNRS